MPLAVTGLQPNDNLSGVHAMRRSETETLCGQPATIPKPGDDSRDLSQVTCPGCQNAIHDLVWSKKARGPGPRVREVLDALCAGYSNREIAERLSISENTVRSHVKEAMQHFDVKNRTQLALVWLSARRDEPTEVA